MASQEAHDWWGDVQDERDALGSTRGRRRPVAVWADEDDFDLMPAHVMARRPVSDELAPRRAARRPAEDDVADAHVARDVDVLDDAEAEVPVRGHRFVRAPRPEARREEPAPAALAPRRIVLESEGDIDHVLPPRGEGIVQIKGRPEERRAPLPARYERRPSRTAREIVEHQPDRIMFWVTALGFLLILLAFATG